MATEEQNVLVSTEPVSSGPTPTFDSQRQNASDKMQGALIASNAVIAKKINSPKALPTLQESTQTGYKAGKSFPVVCCTVGPHLIEKNTAYDYVMMASVAAQDGITITITEAFRSNERQTQLAKERSNPEVAKTLGVAAAPGFSNHQAGIALDLNVKMNKAMYLANQFTAEYLWLQKFGAEFGFDHVEGAKVNEPWHWTHLQQKIIGSPAFESATGFSVIATNTATAAAASNQPGPLRSVYLQAHDADVGLARASEMAQSTRASLQAAHSEFCANQSVGISNNVSQYEASTLEVQPTSFDVTTLDSFSYNFATGLWGDHEPV